MQPPLSPAEKAFQTLLDRYSPAKQAEIMRAMSILGLTPKDPVWLSVVIGVDLIEALTDKVGKAADDFNGVVDNGLTRLEAATGQLTSKADAVASAGTGALASLETATNNALAAASALSVSASNAAATVASTIGAQILNQYSQRLKTLTTERDQSKASASRANRWLQAAILVAVLLTGGIIGYWLTYHSELTSIEHELATQKHR